MGARNGKQFLAGLREQEREVWLGGERVRDVTTHPGLAGGARAIASLYDMQCEPELRDEMTYVSPSSGERVGLSFIIPRTREDLARRSRMMLNWARAACGMIGRATSARDQVKLFRLAWDLAGTSFGSRQVLYERFFARSLSRAVARRSGRSSSKEQAGWPSSGEITE